MFFFMLSDICVRFLFVNIFVCCLIVNIFVCCLIVNIFVYCLIVNIIVCCLIVNLFVWLSIRLFICLYYFICPLTLTNSLFLLCFVLLAAEDGEAEGVPKDAQHRRYRRQDAGYPVPVQCSVNEIFSQASPWTPVTILKSSHNIVSNKSW